MALLGVGLDNEKLSSKRASNTFYGDINFYYWSGEREGVETRGNHGNNIN